MKHPWDDGRELVEQRNGKQFPYMDDQRWEYFERLQRHAEEDAARQEYEAECARQLEIIRTAKPNDPLLRAVCWYIKEKAHQG